jgi:MurNAc alpha-1-phosphate uridylyltransferase
MIFAAGLGTRLKPFTDQHPKALAPVNGKSLLQHNIQYLQRFGIFEVVVNVHHFAEQIEAELTNHNGFGSTVHISDERDAVLETGGGLLHAASFFNEEHFVVMNVDMLTNLNLQHLIDTHRASDAVANLAVMRRESSRQLLFDQEMQLCAWRNHNDGAMKIARPFDACQEYAFSGIQIVHTDFYKYNALAGKFSIIDAYLLIAQQHTVRGFDHTGDLILDVGKPASLELAAQLF